MFASTTKEAINLKTTSTSFDTFHVSAPLLSELSSSTITTFEASDIEAVDLEPIGYKPLMVMIHIFYF